MDSKVKISVLKELVFAKSEFLDLVKVDFLKLSDFLDFAKIVEFPTLIQFDRFLFALPLLPALSAITPHFIIWLCLSSLALITIKSTSQNFKIIWSIEVSGVTILLKFLMNIKY